METNAIFRNRKIHSFNKNHKSVVSTWQAAFQGLENQQRLRPSSYSPGAYLPVEERHVKNNFRLGALHKIPVQRDGEWVRGGGGQYRREISPVTALGTETWEAGRSKGCRLLEAECGRQRERHAQAADMGSGLWFKEWPGKDTEHKWERLTGHHTRPCRPGGGVWILFRVWWEVMQGSDLELTCSVLLNDIRLPPGVSVAVSRSWETFRRLSL